MILVRVPFPQGTNEGYRTVIIQGRARLILSPEIAAWKQTLTLLLKPERPDWLDERASNRTSKSVAQARGRHTVEFGLGIVWLLAERLPYSRDLDGPLKFIQDCVAKAWGFNDSQIRSVVMTAAHYPFVEETVLGIHLCRRSELVGPTPLIQIAHTEHMLRALGGNHGK